MDSDERQNGAEPLQVHLEPFQEPADLDPVHRRTVHADVLPRLRHPQAHRQRSHPGQGFRDARRDTERAADFHRESVRRGVADAFRGVRTRPHGRPDRAQHGVPGLCRHQRHVQAVHQHVQGPAGRAHAAPPSLPAGRPRPQVSVSAVPQGAQLRDRHHDQGRGRPAGRLHRRGFRDTGLPCRPGPVRPHLHHASELAAGHGDAGDPGAADRTDSEAARPPASAGAAAAADGTRPVGTRERDRRRRHRHQAERRHQFRALRHCRPARPDILHPLRLLSVEVHGEVHQQLPRPVHPLRLLSRRRHTGDPRQPGHRAARGGHRRLQGPARPGQGTHRLGLPAPRRASEIPAGRECLRHHASGSYRLAGGQGRTGSAPQGPADLQPGVRDR